MRKLRFPERRQVLRIAAPRPPFVCTTIMRGDHHLDLDDDKRIPDRTRRWRHELLPGLLDRDPPLDAFKHESDQRRVVEQAQFIEVVQGS